MSNDIKTLTIKCLLDGSNSYTIPMYQRNYSWGEKEIIPLIRDFIDYYQDEEKCRYYIGTLVVFERKEKTSHNHSVYEVIDGQQRLTTLFLLACYLKEKGCDVSSFKEKSVDFDSRKNSRQTLAVIFNGDKYAHDNQWINTAISGGYEIIRRELPQIIAQPGNEIELKDFCNFLFNNVFIIRVKVPDDTDLNHYFEIMNTRGEQLEKHEILKSRMLDKIENDKESQDCFSIVWEACANMEKYVQVGFSKCQRKAIFGNEQSHLEVNCFEELQEKIAHKTKDSTDMGLKLDYILSHPPDTSSKSKNNKQSDDKEASERFNSVINFPNFLMHVLRVQTEENVPLNDNKLIPEFEKYILKSDDVAKRVKEFAFNLLRCKNLYDCYIIKREFVKGSDFWSLKHLIKASQKNRNYVNTFDKEDTGGSEHRQILMLLSAFHVSSPAAVYKYWLNAALQFLFNAETVDKKEYLDHLESTAKSFIFDGFLSKDDKTDYFKIISENRCRCQTQKGAEHLKNIMGRLSFKGIMDKLIFNFLDYLLWKKYKDDDKHNGKIKGYEFTFRSSVEHYYPQNPMEGKEPLDPDVLDAFGNLCLISHSKNSRLSNHSPAAKKEYYDDKFDSIKQYLMMKYSKWEEDQIRKHGEEMKEVLLKSLD